MTSEIFFKNFHFKNISTQKKPNPNNKINSNNKKNIKSLEKQRTKNQIITKKIKYNPKNIKFINYRNGDNVHNYYFGRNRNDPKIWTKQTKYKCIPISEFPKRNEDYTYDNLEYIKYIHNSIIVGPNMDPEKIKTVDANKYINNENNSISTFNELKLKLLNKNNKFNTPFVFYKNDIDFDDYKKVEDEKNYQIKRYRYLKAYKYSFNPVIRRKNSKIIQKWWRNKIIPKIDKRKKIIKLQSVFRGYITRKNLNDIILISVIYQNFINKLRHALSNFVRRNYFPKRYYKKKYALEKIFPLKLKVYLRRWKKITDLYSEQEKAAEYLYKTRIKKRYVLLVIKTYFHIWKLKCQQLRKIEENIISMKKQHQKYSALAKLFTIMERVGKKNAYYLSIDNIHKYLIYIYQNKYAKKLLELYDKYKLKKYLKKYFDIWRNQNWREKEKRLKLKVLENEIMTQIRKNDKDFMRNNLNNLRTKTNLQNINNLKRLKKEFVFPEGIKHIITCVRKNIIRLIFNEYIRKRNLQKKLLKIIHKKLIKYYMKQWKNIVDKMLQRDKAELNLKKIILKFEHLSYNIIISKYFHKWNNMIYMNKYKNQKLNIYNKFCTSLKNYVMNYNKKVLEHKQIFLTKKLKRYINTHSEVIRKKLVKCFNTYVNKDKFLKIKKALDKWKKYVQFCKLNDLKAKNLATVSKLTKIIYNSKKLSKNLYEWKEKNILLHYNKKNILKNNIYNLVNCLTRIKNNKMKEFFNSLRKAKIKSMRQMILKILADKYIKKILSIYFNKYRINTIQLQNKYKLGNINKLNKLKEIINNKIKKEEIHYYERLNRYLHKWYFISKLINKENYNQFLINIKNALTIISSVTTRKALRNPFEKIKGSSINNKNIILKRIKKYFDKNDKTNVRNAFLKFFKNTQYNSKNAIKSNVIYILKLKNEQIRKRTLITKYLNKWKMLTDIYNSQRNNNTSLIIIKIKKIMKKIKQKTFINQMKKIKYYYDLKNMTEKLFKIYNNIEQRALSKYLNKWKNSATGISTIMNKREKGYEIIYKTLSKAYSYKKLEEVLIPLLINNYKKRYLNIFFNKFKKLYWVKINSKYKALLKNDIIPKKFYNFKFKKTIKPNCPTCDDDIEKKEKNDGSNKNIEENRMNKNAKSSKYKVPRYFLSKRTYLKSEKEKNAKNIIVSNNINIKKDRFYNERLIPYLVNYLNELRKNKLRLVFQYFKYLKKNNLFCKLVKSWTNNQNLIHKQSLRQSLKQSKNKIQLNKIMRRSIINKLTNVYLAKTKRRNDLLILMHKMKVFKKINKIKKTLRFLRIWRVYVKVLRDRASQLEKYQKSINETSEKLSYSIFVDNSDEKSVNTQVLSFLDNINNDEKTKIKNSLGVSRTSLNSYLSGKITNNEIINGSDSNFTFNNEEENEANISLGKFYKYKGITYNRTVSYSNTNSPRKIKSSLFKNNKK